MTEEQKHMLEEFLCDLSIAGVAFDALDWPGYLAAILKCFDLFNGSWLAVLGLLLIRPLLVGFSTMLYIPLHAELYPDDTDDDEDDDDHGGPMRPRHAT